MSNLNSVEKVIKRTRKFTDLSIATSFANRQKYYSPVLLGDNGKFFVATTRKECGILIENGYEVA